MKRPIEWYWLKGYHIPLPRVKGLTESERDYWWNLIFGYANAGNFKKVNEVVSETEDSNNLDLILNLLAATLPWKTEIDRMCKARGVANHRNEMLEKAKLKWTDPLHFVGLD